MAAGRRRAVGTQTHNCRPGSNLSATSRVSSWPYRRLNETFNPDAFEPTEWASIARAAGMKYFNFTTKHHDGFCLWDTRTTDYRVTHPSCPFHTHAHADVVRALFDAFRAAGLAISCYFSKSDWHCPYYWKPDQPATTRNPSYDARVELDTWRRFVESHACAGSGVD